MGGVTVESDGEMRSGKASWSGGHVRTPGKGRPGREKSPCQDLMMRTLVCLMRLAADGRLAGPETRGMGRAT